MKQRAKQASRSPASAKPPKGGPGAAAYRDAVRAAESGNIAMASALYAHCLDLDPRHVEALHDLGVLAAQRGAGGEAAKLFEAAIALRPHYVEAHANLCLLLGNAGRVEEAVEAGRKAVECEPAYARAHSNLGNALEAKGDLDHAVKFYETATRLDPRFGAVYVKLAGVLNRQGKHQDAHDFADKGIALHPTLAEAFKVRGIIRIELGLPEGAQEDFRCALTLDPSSATHHVNLASTLINAGDLDAAEPLLRRALTLNPDHADAHGNLGTLLLKRGLARQAFDAYHTAVTLDPNYGQAYSNLAGLLRDVGEVDAAVSMGELAIRLMPGSTDAYINIAGAYRQQGRQAEAIAAYRQALVLKPDLGEVRVELCYYRQQACEWADLAAEQEAAMTASFRAGQRVAPFPVMTFDSSPADQLLAARVWASGLPSGPRLAPYAPRPIEKRNRRLRIGYLSADYYNHATAMLIVELFERHDKSRFEIFGYSIGRDDGSTLRHRVVAAFDHFVDLRVYSHLDAAKRIHADEIDILIDLKGYTEEARSEILAYRPAPIQVNYLGFPATMGAPFIDYLVADSTVAPMANAGHFDETIVHLPGCYQPNDRRRAVAERPSRAECGLPEAGFVFCSFNNSYKITPAFFDIWMRLLIQTPGSVLWLLETNDRVADNLRQEAEARGVEPARLIFAPRTSAIQHLGRLGVADLFLDTLPVNAHTTASESLWVGLPLITCKGQTFAARVAASLLQAVGLPELVTEALADYEALALALAHDPRRLGELRRRLESNRASAPLFDTDRYIRHYEAALLRMATLRDAGHPPEAFAVVEEEA